MTNNTDVFSAAWLVWVKGTGGKACPQIWHEPFVGVSASDVLAKHKLPVGADTYLSLNSLAELYPFGQRIAA